MKEIARYSRCFVCGDKNNIGLKAKFFSNEGRAVTEYTAERRFEGYLGILHGGITSALLDEVMIKALLAREILAMTVELTVRFKKAVNVGDKLYLEGRIVREQGRLYITSGEVKTDSGEIVASAAGKYLRVNDSMKDRLLQSLDV